MSILAAFNSARASLLAQSRALAVTSNNVGNANTPGYTRLRPIFTPIPSSVEGFSIGGGASVGEVQRVVDAAVDLQLHREHQQLSYNEHIERGLSSVEGIFEELGGTGIGAALSAFFSSLGDLANDPSNTAVREGVVQSADTLVGLIRDADRRLADRQVDANNQLAQSLTEANAIAANLAELNRQIFSSETGTGNEAASALRDQRTALLTDLAEHVDFTYFERPDGTISVFVAGGMVLVDGNMAASLEARTGAPGNPAFFDVYHNLQGTVNGPVTGRILGGKAGAALDMRDNRLASYRDSMDEFAFTLARRLNDEHYGPLPAPPPGDAFGLVDNVSRRFFVDGSQTATAEGADFTLIGGAAAHLAIHADILLDPRHIAAGATSVGGGGASAGDNENALEMAGIQFGTADFFQITRDATGAEIAPGVAPNGTAHTLNNFLTSVSGRLGAELLGSRRALEQEELIVSELEQRRASLSGVSMDEEVANLIRYERAYEAAAKVIQDTDRLLGVLMEI